MIVPGSPNPLFLGKSPISVVHTGNSQLENSSTSQTHSSMPIGAASADRILVVCHTAFTNSVIASTSCTIGGVAASTDVFAAGSRDTMSIHSLRVPSGTTANIVMTHSAAIQTSNIAVFAIYGCNNLDFAISNATHADPIQLTQTIKDETAVVASVANRGFGSSYSWSGTSALTSLSNTSSNSQVTMSRAARAVLNQITSATIIADYLGTAATQKILAVGFRP